jgi:ArsR family transcriptional regulator, virulence genes transcriptional regulator
MRVKRQGQRQATSRAPKQKPRTADGLTIYSTYRKYESMKISTAQMQASAGAAEELLKAIANRHRLMILCQLIDGDRSVGELAELVCLRVSTMSQHLALLRRDGLVSTRRDGQTIWYAISSAPARKLLETLHQIYCAPTPLCGSAANKHAATDGK